MLSNLFLIDVLAKEAGVFVHRKKILLRLNKLEFICQGQTLKFILSEHQ
jgi:hypothetical protein